MEREYQRSEWGAFAFASDLERPTREQASRASGFEILYKTCPSAAYKTRSEWRTKALECAFKLRVSIQKPASNEYTLSLDHLTDHLLGQSSTTFCAHGRHLQLGHCISIQGGCRSS
jgi:hypothetical protein